MRFRVDDLDISEKEIYYCGGNRLDEEHRPACNLHMWQNQEDMTHTVGECAYREEK